MAKSSKEAYGAEGTFTGLHIDPTSLVIVGLDCPEDVCPELADPSRIDAPVDTLVESVAEYGIKEPVLVRKVGDSVIVVDGRQRVMAAREVAKRQRKAKADATILVPCVVDKAASAQEAAATMIVTNEHRREDTTLTKARKAQALSVMGHDDKRIGTMFGVSRVTLANWRHLLNCTPAILRKVEASRVPATLAFEIGKLPAAEQDAKLAELEAAQATKGGAAIEHVRRTRGGNGAAVDLDEDEDGDAPESAPKSRPVAVRSAWSRKHVQRLQSFLDPASYADDDAPEEHRIAHAILTIILGDDPTMAGLKPWPELRRDCKGIGPEAEAKAAAKAGAKVGK